MHDAYGEYLAHVAEGIHQNEIQEIQQTDFQQNVIQEKDIKKNNTAECTSVELFLAERHSLE
jgi:hypothetical protein